MLNGPSFSEFIVYVLCFFSGYGVRELIYNLQRAKEKKEEEK